MSQLPFHIDATSPHTLARATTLHTLHGPVQTPVFMPVGTQATVKGMRVEELKEVGSQIILGNTYHLLLRPGPRVFERFGGIHKFMNWSGPVLTDSGGFQIFSLPNERKIVEQGAFFKSYVDGQKILLSPEASIAMQRSMQSDIMMVLDECVPSTSPHEEAARAMGVTHRWALRSLEARGDSPQALFAIVQGACFEDLRKESADFLTAQPFDGFAIGGLAVGETREEREHFTEVTSKLLPPHKPRYLMGVGMPIDLLEAVHRGVDMFDCIIPSALAQQGTAFTHQGLLRLRRGIYKFDQDPIDPTCSCYTCTHYSRAYLHHLIKSSEGLGWHLITHHNLEFYHELTSEMRDHIIKGTFYKYYQEKRTLINRKDSDGLERGVVILKGASKSEQTTQKDHELGRYRIEPRRSSNQDESLEQTWYLVDIPSGEAMHPTRHPGGEAHELYVQGSSLLQDLSEHPKQRQDGSPMRSEEFNDLQGGQTVVIWDVGLGAGYNAMAAIRYFSQLGRKNIKMHIISFENDLDSFKLALKHRDKFLHLRHEAPGILLKTGSWNHPHGRVTWELCLGDFASQMTQTHSPHVIFYDPFSGNTNPQLWSFEVFKKIFGVCQQHAELLTYSASTRVRSALLGAGFHVGRLPTSAPQGEATFAVTPQLARDLKSRGTSRQFLHEPWLKKWEVSSAQIPWDVIKNQGERPFSQLIMNHPQFLS